MSNRYEIFTVLVTKINRNIRRIKNREMKEYGLRSPHISCLYYLYCAPGLSARDLCERCDEDKAAISRSLEYLEKEGYLFSDPQKRYRSPLYLTEKGKEASGKIADKIDSVFETIGKNLSDEGRSNFYQCLSLISDGLDDIWVNGLGAAGDRKPQEV